MKSVSSIRLLYLGLVLGVLILAGCQADTSDPGANDAGQVAASQEPALEEAQAEVEPATTTAPPTASQDETMGEATLERQTEESAAAGATPVQGSGVANADVEFVRAVRAADGTWRFDVTVRHPDTGWEDYADGWDVVTPDGLVLKANESDRFTRLLTHPHENEQPFTRSRGGIVVPDGVTVVVVRAHDLVDGFGGREVRVDLTGAGGADFEVIRE